MVFLKVVLDGDLPPICIAYILCLILDRVNQRSKVPLHLLVQLAIVCNISSSVNKANCVDLKVKLQ
jgi:hypothetical protein